MTGVEHQETTAGTSRSRRIIADCLRVLVIALSYYAAGGLGLVRQVIVEGAVVTPFWPPTGIAVSALLLWGGRVLPGVMLGALLVAARMSSLNPTSLGFIAGNTLAPYVSFLLLRHTGFRVELDRLRDGALLVFLGAFAGMLTSPTFGTGMLLANGNIDAAAFWPVWSAWWAGDAVGVLVVTPLLLAVRTVRPPRNVPQVLEVLTLLVATAVVAIASTRSPINLLFLVFPLLTWAALRFRLAGGAFCTGIVSVAATVAATDQVGPFSEHTLIEGMISLQALNGSAALTALLLAAITAEKRNTQRKIEQACVELAEMVDRLTPRRRRGP
ncbi:MASE1 domain-containing protein [Streptomyces iconiensis]|uniref:MASE1 domain-containing protein n=1 Tax=Streptomyces iconiensis TaxID=1384038 RepID=A0ABT7A400_9ACTN|nr:MASE1 domain-containing protein [Streptomyces iconiensis]MDJ1136026.1 MASE1 domain-containing protein [Streptomyces iconiensis]